MDTKLKKSKGIISLAAWITGIAILLVNAFYLTGELFIYRGFAGFGKQTAEVLQGDYQNTSEFNCYLSDLLNDFITMSVNGPIYKNRYEYGINYDFDSNTAWEAAEVETAELEYADTFSEDTYVGDTDLLPWEETTEVLMSGEDINPEMLTDASLDAKKEQNRRDAQEYHNNLQKNKNILYTVMREGEVLYTNCDNSLGTSWTELPEGYNYFLCFDGTKVTAFKDGREINIYGDGYYREENDWYVPGYTNFSVGETIKNSRVYMAAVRIPSVVVEKNYDEQGSIYYSNTLANIKDRLERRKAEYSNWIYCSIAGVLLLAFGILFRKDRKLAGERFAFLTGRFWYEVKILLLLPCIAGFIGFVIYMLASGFYYGSSNVSDVMMGMTEMGYSLDVNIVRYILYIILAAGIFFTWAFTNDAKKNEKPWRNSITCRIAGLFHNAELKLPVSKRIMRMYMWIAVSGLLLSLLTVAACILLVDYYWGEGMLVAGIAGLFLAAFWISHFLYAKKNMETAKDMESLVTMISEVHDGNLDRKDKDSLAAEKIADTDIAEAYRNLNEIQSGMNTALEEQMKSERMKVELIANVSHDIKTPLTSIISYVELMKQEDELPEHVKEYVSILESKSQRLKTMVQDVFEVSKAASGELPVNMEDLDIAKLIRQTLADMTEQIESANVIVKEEIPDNAVMIHADGERLYRVFQNLILNAVKYSLGGSRIYITLKEDGQAAIACVKNISKEELPKDFDFTERFTRGDMSRSDGGSGLGLSIAQSFTQACGGTFKVDTIADLFVVTISFSKL